MSVRAEVTDSPLQQIGADHAGGLVPGSSITYKGPRDALLFREQISAWPADLATPLSDQPKYSQPF